MISRQRLYMILSVFFLLLAMVIYIFNGIILPKKLSENTAEIRAELDALRQTAYSVKTEGIEKGIYIDEENQDMFLEKTAVYSSGSLTGITQTDIRKGFYLARSVAKGEILSGSDTLSDRAVENGRLYEIRAGNSFCGELVPGEIVDVISVSEGRVTVVTSDKQIKGVYGYLGGKFIPTGKIQAESEVVIFLDLTEREYENCLSQEVLYIRKAGN